jgi:peptide/nickel transport system permease protein
LGLIAGWYGRWLDPLINGLINLFWSIPFAIFAILILAITGPRTWSIILVIAAVNWVSSARIFRAEALRLRSEPFVRSARGRGFSASHILFFEVIPNLYSTSIILLGLGGAETLSLESGLAYLGMSLPPPLPSWGGMMNEGLAFLSTGSWIALLPAFAIVATLASWRTLTGQIASAAEK